MSPQQSGVSAAEIAAAYDAATPALGAGHALEARLIGAGAYARRLAAARDAAEAAGLDALLIGFGADMRYLTGYAAPALERLTMLVVPVRGEPSLIVPRLEAGMAGDAPAMRGGHVARVAWGETDDPFALVAAAVRAGARAGTAPISVAVSDRLWATFVLRIEAALAPFDVRPHWGKAFTMPGDTVRATIPRATEAAPVPHHAALREGERDEHADHVERDQRVRVATKDDEQHGREHAEADDAVREGESIALIGELAREIAVARQD